MNNKLTASPLVKKKKPVSIQTPKKSKQRRKSPAKDKKKKITLPKSKNQTTAERTTINHEKTFERIEAENKIRER